MPINKVRAVTCLATESVYTVAIKCIMIDTIANLKIKFPIFEENEMTSKLDTSQLYRVGGLTNPQISRVSLGFSFVPTLKYL
jgi:hypothetical protein